MDLIGELVRLRGPRPEDAPVVQRITAVPEVARYAGSPPLFPQNEEQVRETLTRRSPDQLRWIVVCNQDVEVLGSAGLFAIDHRNRNCWLAISIGPPERWGRGYGTEACMLMTRFAFRQLGMEKVYLGVFEGNDRAIRAYEKACFRVEATLPRDHLLEGRLVTKYVMAVYRDDPRYAGPAAPGGALDAC